MKRFLAMLQRQVLPVALCFGVVLALSGLRLFERLENLTMDERTWLRGRFEPSLAADEIAIIGVDATSLHELGRWPWDRDVHGELLQLLARVRPAVVTFDVLFTEPTAQDDYLARAITRNRAVVLGVQRAELDDGTTPEDATTRGTRLEPLGNVIGDIGRVPGSPALLLPTGRMAGVAELGFVDTPPGDDGVRRVAPLVVRVGDRLYPSLALRTLMSYWSVKPQEITVRLGEAVVIDAPMARRRIPIDATGAYAINYRHGRDGFVEYGYSGIRAALLARYAGKQSVAVPGLAGRMLLIGHEADGLSDLGPTPFSPLTPLVLVHANIIENVLREDYLRPVPAIWAWALMCGVALVGVARFSERSPLEQGVFSVGVPLVYVTAGTLAWINGSWVVPMAGPLLGFVAVQGVMIGRRMLAERRAKEQIKGMFGTYVSPELVQRMVASGRAPELGGHEKEITAYFSDIQEFSTFSEVLPPARLVELMNEYLTASTNILQEEGGTLDKYVGDATVAMFGAPVELPDHAHRACRTALRVQESVAQLREKWRRDRTWPGLVCDLRTRIGLNSGGCVIGNMGSPARFNYTMMGDNVNLAARMESGAKSWGTYAMCTEATRVACERHAPGAIVFRPLGRIRVKGRVAAVPIYEVGAAREVCPPPYSECVDIFAEGLRFYQAREWESAAACFARAAKLEPLVPGRDCGVKTNPSLVYLGLVETMCRESLPSDWDGVFVMADK